MLDFVQITVKHKNSSVEITPCFKVIRSKDLMIRGNSFYAIWDEDLQRLSTDEFDAVLLIDAMPMKFVEDNHLDGIPQLLVYADNCLIDKCQKYCHNQALNNYVPLDETLIFSHME